MDTRATSKQLRIGLFDFINSYPLFYPLRTKKIPCNCQFIVGTPLEINSMLQKGEIDIGFISSASFLDNRSSYILLSDYGIGVKERIMNVGLFCNTPSFDFTKAQKFLISAHSPTSARLLKTLTQYYWKSHASFEETTLSETELFHQSLPFLLIGDGCLQKLHTQRKEPSATLSYCDLITEWHAATQKGFVFALVATRNDSFLTKQKLVLEFHTALCKAYSWSKANRTKLISLCAKKIKVSRGLMEEYFRSLDYELLQEHINGLDHLDTFVSKI